MSTGDPNPTSNYWLCPLLFFNCAPEVVDLDYRPVTVELAEAIQVRRVPAELTDYLNKYHPDWLDVVSSEYMAVLPCSVSRDGEITGTLPQLFEASNLLFDVVTALRLVHEGVVEAGPLLLAIMRGSTFHMFRRSHLPVEFFSDISKIEIDSALLDQPEYEFSSSDIPVVNKLLREIRNYRKSGRLTALDGALRRFNSAYHGELEDRLIDQMIAFESLYIADDKELGYKLAIRTAFFLGKRRSKIFDEMKKAYDLRGKIVHGNKKVDRSKLEEAIPMTEEYLRQSLRRFLFLLARGRSLKEIRDKLDENILKNGKILSLKE